MLMKLSRTVNIDDLRLMAKARLPRMIFDYIDGGAEDEVTLQRAVSRFDDYEMTWRVLKDVAEIDTATKIMGQETRLPFLVSPTATTRLFHPAEGELAMARAANRQGVIYSCSTLASQTVEDIAKASSGPKWVQVYVWKDKSVVKDFLERAKAAGFTGCILTVDLAVAGKRERDPRNHFSIPPALSVPLAAQAIARPGWLWQLLTGPQVSAANFKRFGKGNDIMSFINGQLSRSVTWEDAAWMKQQWGDGFAIKGISRVEDARRCVDIGADAVWISNHGGRQLDTSVPTIDLVPEIASAVGAAADIIVDGGVRRGSHIAKLLMRGATGVALGRAALYGLGAGGEDGVRRALAMLEDELRRTMALLGATRLSEMDASLLRMRAG